MSLMKVTWLIYGLTVLGEYMVERIPIKAVYLKRLLTELELPVGIWILILRTLITFPSPQDCGVKISS